VFFLSRPGTKFYYRTPPPPPLFSAFFFPFGFSRSLRNPAFSDLIIDGSAPLFFFFGRSDLFLLWFSFWGPLPGLFLFLPWGQFFPGFPWGIRLSRFGGFGTFLGAVDFLVGFFSWRCFFSLSLFFRCPLSTGFGGQCFLFF